MANTTDFVGTLFDNSESNPSKITLAFTMAGVALKKKPFCYCDINGGCGASGKTKRARQCRYRRSVRASW